MALYAGGARVVSCLSRFYREVAARREKLPASIVT